MKTKIVDDVVLRQLEEDTEDLQQRNFDKLVRSGTICLEGCEYIEIDDKEIRFEGDFTL